MYTHKKEDPRATRSKKMFKNAVYSLLAENPDISQLTVQKIAKRSELHRATFYLHYEDINDLLRQISQEIFEDLSIKIEPILQLKKTNEQEQLISFLDYIYDFRKLFAVFLEHTGFKNNLFKLIKNMVEMRRKARNIESTKNLVSIDIISSSLLGIIMWWIKDGVQYSSEYIAGQITTMYRRPI